MFEKQEYLLEMATICNLDNYKITVYPEPQGNPSFHVIYKNDWEVVLQIKDFKILESKFGPFVKGDQLPNSIKKHLIALFKTKLKKIRIWDYLLLTWNSNNPGYEISDKIRIPN